jgi:opacity protein-like surface antigen
MPGSRWVFGVEADASLMNSDGTATCFAVSFEAIATTCRTRPQTAGTLTGRVGYVFGPSGRAMIYGKAGLAWGNDKIDMALNTFSAQFQFGSVPGGIFAIAPNISQKVGLWGGTVGIGVERALTPAWSLKVEYDYVGFRNSNVTNVGFALVSPVITAPFTLLTLNPPGTSGVSQSFQEVKVGLNYKWGADPWAAAWNTGPVIYPNILPAIGWEFEGGGRYFASWGQFQKDLGLRMSRGQTSISDASRLIYDDLQTHSGEFFGRIETPWNLFLKGYVGGGWTDNGHSNDEDFVIGFSSLLGGYSNTLSPAVTGKIRYGVIDGGYDFLRGPGYKIGIFAGYFKFDQQMNAFGCTAIAFLNCTPNPVPTSGSPIITEADTWKAVRVGLSAETMLTDRVKISGEAAYLPRVWFNGVDQHFIGNSGVLAEVFPETARGSGVQLEALLSYYLTPQWSVGIGGRYWGMWTNPEGQFNCIYGPPFCSPVPTQPQFFKSQVEQLGAFVQTSYKLDWGNSVAVVRK